MFPDELYDHSVKATNLAARVFDGVTDRAGERYFMHCLTVGRNAHAIALAIGLPGKFDAARCYVVGVLHDVVEDTDYTVEDIAREFDVTIAELVDNVTKREGESREGYMERIKRDPISIVVKLADANHNSQMSRYSKVTPRDIERSMGYAKKAYKLAALLGLHSKG